MLPPLFVSIANQKGGVGKSTLTTLLATLLHEAGFRVAIFDCDHQRSIFNHRQAELDELSAAGKPAPEGLYPIAAMALEQLPEYAQQYQSGYDYVFIDIPGSFKERGFGNVFKITNLVVMPIVASRYDVDSTYEAIDILKRARQLLREQAGRTLSISLVLNKFKKTVENLELQRELGAFARGADCHLFPTPIRDVTRYQRDLSTVSALRVKEENDEIVRFSQQFVALGEQLRALAQTESAATV